MADFNWYLSRQGARGMQGIQGEQGFSPVITVAEDTPAAYILRIQTQNDTFLTTNLRGSVEDLGGTYVRYNRETGQMYAGSPDIATTTEAGIVRMASSEDVANLEQDSVVTPYDVNNMINALDLSNKYVDLVTDQKIDGIKQFEGKLVAPSGIYGANVNGAYAAPFIKQYSRTSMSIGLPTATTIQIGQIGGVNGNKVTIYANNPRITSKDSTGTHTGDILSSYNFRNHIPNATTETTGLVKPDGNSITVDENGTIRANNQIDTSDFAKLKEDNYFTATNTFSAGLVASNIILTQETDKPILGDNAVIIQSQSDNRPVLIKPSYMDGDIGLKVKKDGLVYTDETGKSTDLLAGDESARASDKYGIRGDYSTHWGILDCPNGLIDYNATGKEITLSAGIVLQLAGQDSKTTIASAITKTLTSTTPITLFYGGGELIEVGQIDYSIKEPSDNGVENYQAWFNPEIGKWQFKSNATGNVWRELVATPIANINMNGSNITRVDYIGYRILDDDIIAQQSDIENLQNIITTLQQTIATLENRIEALETEINGGSSTSPSNPTVRGIQTSIANATYANTNVNNIQSEAKEQDGEQ